MTSEIEAEDLRTTNQEEEEPVGLFRQILFRMNPSQCLAPTAPCHNPLFDQEDVEEIVERLLPNLRNGGKLRTTALLKLYRLTDKERQENRVPIICTTRFNILASLVPCLSLTDSSAADRRQALMLINNLCIPMENKAAILLGEPHKLLLPAVLSIISNRMPESYLAAVCLFNLSFLEEGQSLLFYYVPPPPSSSSHNNNNEEVEAPTEYRHSTPLENTTCLFRTLESAIQDFLPFVMAVKEQQQRQQQKQHQSTVVVSVEGEVVRWGLGCLGNLVSVNPAAVATQSIVPHAAVQSLQAYEKVDLSLWKRDSLPDASLTLLIRLAQDASCVSVLQRSQEAKDALQTLEGRGGIHETRAMALLEFLQQPPQLQQQLQQQRHSSFPKRRRSAPQPQRRHSSPRREEKKAQEWV